MIQRILLLITLVFLSGCSTVQFNLRENYDFDKSQDKSIIFGEVKFIGFNGHLDGGISMEFDRIGDNKRFRVHATGSTFMQQIGALSNKGLNYFYFELPQGTYQITLVERGNWEVRPKSVIFMVPKPGLVYYLGQLAFLAIGKPGLFALSFNYEVRVINNYDENIKVFRERFAHINQEIKIELMKVKNEQDNSSANYSVDIPYIPTAGK